MEAYPVTVTQILRGAAVESIAQLRVILGEQNPAIGGDEGEEVEEEEEFVRVEEEERVEEMKVEEEE